MDESNSFRRAFLAGLLTLGVALAGQMATSRLDAAHACARPDAAFASSVQQLVQLDREASFVQVERRGGLAERVARAVLGVVLNGFA